MLLWTTPLARNPDLKAADAWNEFPEYWPFLVLTNMTVPYMSGASDDRTGWSAWGCTGSRHAAAGHGTRGSSSRWCSSGATGGGHAGDSRKRSARSACDGDQRHPW